jgi:general secretion pathway protein G
MHVAIVEDQATVVAHRDRGFSLIQMRTKIRQQGFTLLEIMLVVSIIVIILGVAISKLGNTTAIAKTMRVQADIQAIKTQLQLYESMNGFFPTTEQGLQALVTQPQNDPRPTRWYQLFRELPKDPWGSDYIYRNPGLKNPSGYDLYSAGPDRQPDTSDDDWGGG